jgi:hypothetical protein
MDTNIQQNKRLFIKKTVGEVSRTNDVPYIEYVLSFLKNDYVQHLPVILPNIIENQYLWHMHIFYIYIYKAKTKLVLFPAYRPSLSFTPDPKLFMATDYVTYQNFLSRHSNKEKYVYGTVLVHDKKQNSLVNEPNKCLRLTLFLNFNDSENKIKKKTRGPGATSLT